VSRRTKLRYGRKWNKLNRNRRVLLGALLAVLLWSGNTVFRAESFGGFDISVEPGDADLSAFGQTDSPPDQNIYDMNDETGTVLSEGPEGIPGMQEAEGGADMQGPDTWPQIQSTENWTWEAFPDTQDRTGLWDGQEFHGGGTDQWNSDPGLWIRSEDLWDQDIQTYNQDTDDGYGEPDAPLQTFEENNALWEGEEWLNPEDGESSAGDVTGSIQIEPEKKTYAVPEENTYAPWAEAEEGLTGNTGTQIPPETVSPVRTETPAAEGSGDFPAAEQPDTHYYKEDSRPENDRTEGAAAFVCKSADKASFSTDEEDPDRIHVVCAGSLAVLALQSEGREILWHWEGNDIVLESNSGGGEDGREDLTLLALLDGKKLYFWSPESSARAER